MKKLLALFLLAALLLCMTACSRDEERDLSALDVYKRQSWRRRSSRSRRGSSTPSTRRSCRSRVTSAPPTRRAAKSCATSAAACKTPVSYTHLDVYKRQLYNIIIHFSPNSNRRRRKIRISFAARVRWGHAAQFLHHFPDQSENFRRSARTYRIGRLACGNGLFYC